MNSAYLFTYFSTGRFFFVNIIGKFDLLTFEALQTVYFGDHFLTKTGHELTAVRLFLDDKGNVEDLSFIEKLLITKNGILKQ